MGKKLLNNWGLKLLSVILAIVTWVLVLFLVDPVTDSEPYEVTVKILNRNAVTEIDKVFTVIDKSANITVTLTGTTSQLAEIESEDIVATADMLELIKWQSDISEEDASSMRGTIPIRVECKGIPARNISISSQTVKVSIENIHSSEFVVNVSTNNTSPASGYVVGSLNSSVKTVTISGAESLVSKIQKVEAEVDVTNISSDKEFENVTLNIYDKNGDKLTADQIENLEFSTSSRTHYVNVEVALWRVRDDVELRVESSGTPAVGYRCTSVDVTPSKISIAGTDAALKELKDNDYVIYIEQPISVSGAKADVEQTIDITEFLPENTKLAEDVTESVYVTAKISPITSKIIDVPISEIAIAGLSEGYLLSFEKAGSVKIELKGLEDELALLEEAGIESKDIKVELDVSGYTTTGEYTVTLVSSLSASFKDELAASGFTIPYIEIPEVKINIKLDKEVPETTVPEETSKEASSS